jgi:membrane-bound lytic murein transglycosylase D
VQRHNSRFASDVKCIFRVLAILSLTCPVLAQQQAPTPDQLAQSVEQWLQDNLDENVLEALSQIDQERVRAFFTELQRRFAGTSIDDLGSLKETADRLLPVLQQFEETQPYALWLQTHLDYLDTAEQLRRQTKPSAKPGTPVPLPSPSPLLQRTIWTKQLERRPLPSLAQNYLPRLKKIFASERVPPELAWVAEVESSFNPEARSPAGAAGLFQLMPATARTLNLASWPRDERLEPEKSARAAAKYLRSLHGRYGDWRLTLAAYNAGGTRVDHLLKQSQAHTFDAISGRLPAETQMYVPKIEATLRKREGVALAELRIPKG